MKYRYLRAFIVLLAGLITIIINIKTKKDDTSSLLILLAVLVIFYFIATLFVEILQHSLVPKDDGTEDSMESEENESLSDSVELEENENITSKISFDEDE